MDDAPAVRLEAWSGTWSDDDPHANFKREVAQRALVDPLPTLERLASAVGRLEAYTELRSLPSCSGPGCQRGYVRSVPISKFGPGVKATSRRSTLSVDPPIPPSGFAA